MRDLLQNKRLLCTYKQERHERIVPTGTEPSDNDSGNSLIVKVIHQSKLYTDNTGRFPLKSRGGIQYVMIAYHSSSLILAELFATRKDKQRVPAYDAIHNGNA